jgi:hypothetical protein
MSPKCWLEKPNEPPHCEFAAKAAKNAKKYMISNLENKSTCNMRLFPWYLGFIATYLINNSFILAFLAALAAQSVLWFRLRLN